MTYFVFCSDFYEGTELIECVSKEAAEQLIAERLKTAYFPKPERYVVICGHKMKVEAIAVATRIRLG